MFARVYSRYLKHGDLKALAHDTNKSLEWLSRMTRPGGTDDPGTKYVRWFDILFEQNEGCALAIEEAVSARLAEIKSHSLQESWKPQATAVALLKQATQTISALLETPTKTDDLPALLDLKVMLEKAIDSCGTREPRNDKSR